jgi:hypothetical protein
MIPPPAADATMEENIRYLIQFAVDSQKQSQETRSLLVANQERIAKTEAEVTTLKCEVKRLKEIVNSNEQLNKSLSIRILGLAPTEDEINSSDTAAATAKMTYDRVIRPILVSAKAKGKIASVPLLGNTIGKAFRTAKLSPSQSNISPPIIVTVASSAIKLAILMNKKDALPTPSPADRANGAKRITISEDLTMDSFALLKRLREDKRVSRAWSVEGQLKYIKANDPDNIVQRVKSVYDTLEQILG